MYAQRKETGANRIPKKLSRGQKNYSKEKAAEHYAKNKGAIKENQESIIKTCHKKKKTRLKSTIEKRTKNLLNTKKKC